VVQVIERLPSQHKALSSNPKKEKKKRSIRVMVSVWLRINAYMISGLNSEGSAGPLGMAPPCFRPGTRDLRIPNMPSHLFVECLCGGDLSRPFIYIDSLSSRTSFDSVTIMTSFYS
jgi:hypothetical protein